MKAATANETLDPRPAFDVREAEYLRLLGYPRGHVPSARALELAGWARDWYQENGRPWTYMRRVELRVAGEALLLDGQEFQSGRMREHLRHHGAVAAMLLAVSAGRECEAEARRLWDEGKPDEYFFLEVFGSAVVEDLVARVSGRACELANKGDLMAVPHYSPGYAGWDVADQPKLFGLIAQGMSSAFPGPIEVMSSGMLRPKKSMLAVFGLAPSKEAANGTNRATPCAGCSFSPCQYRREPYRHRAESLAEMAGFASIYRLENSAASAAVNVKYSVNSRALRKWAAERVRISPADDGAIEAVFRFDGTTCSNMGRSLAFDYRVRLGGADRHHRILDASCAPAPGDDGYKFTCAYQNDPDGHIHELSADKPLLGRPLGDVLEWSRAVAPSGCHCSPDSRIHKWGLAFEAIHFALFQDQVHNDVS